MTIPVYVPIALERETMDDLNGLDLIAFERRRQIGHPKGYDSRHDDDHQGGELAINAQMVLLAVIEGQGAGYQDDWGIVAKHGYDDPVKLLTIAGALIAAEIDRRIRAARRVLAEPK